MLECGCLTALSAELLAQAGTAVRSTLRLPCITVADEVLPYRLLRAGTGGQTLQQSQVRPHVGSLDDGMVLVLVPGHAKQDVVAHSLVEDERRLGDVRHLQAGCTPEIHWTLYDGEWLHC